MRKMVWLVVVLMAAVSSVSLAGLMVASPFALRVQSNYQASVTFLGKTVGERVSDLSFELHGVVTELPINDGMSVKKGQLIAALDTGQLEQRHKQLTAQLRGVLATIKLSRKELKRLSVLVAKHNISQQTFDR